MGNSVKTIQGKVRLVSACTEQLVVVKGWFNSYAEIHTWGGPELTYPITDQDFVTLLQATHLHSYVLLDENATLLAFGQHYLRIGRHHLGRLVVNPAYRGKGLGKMLVRQLLDKAYTQQVAEHGSLFVFTSNKAAYDCYQKLGFVEYPYPDGVPGNMPNCIYMIRAY
ncbi:GNAT family N-acetyltransferase [Paraglaciecola aquimarina]|uniref:GNAT family N-acetyltransferase n=1 Tax=Paraglaciecola aquimarina TaxID=1235557 RepID=A0ABU3SUD0_9ALTE|nr:GNAT family N-acetyltransferase [Paraglaciecola aquimarina]MDU0353598.1 GNAT family N-acetyltransferase [Paraglaciecola aquimarina]